MQLCQPMRISVVGLLVCLLSGPGIGWGQDQPEPSVEPAASSTSDSQNTEDVSLKQQQDAIGRRYQRFEKTLLQMAQYLRKTDPERADLLVRAIGQSKQDRIVNQLDQIVELLTEANPRYGDAIDRQTEVLGQLRSLLDLLQSEDRKTELEREQERIKDILKDVRTIMAHEKDVRAATERGGDAQRLTDGQQKVAEDTGRLVKKIDAQDAEKAGGKSGAKGEANDGEQGDGQGGDQHKDKGAEGKQEGKHEGKPSQSAGDGKQPEDGQKPAGKSDSEKPGQTEPERQQRQAKGQGRSQNQGQSQKQEGQQGNQQQGPSQQGQQQQQGQPGGQNGQQQQSPQQEQPGENQRTAGRDEIEQARQQMQRAIEELKKQNPDEASSRQDEALAKLQQAKEKLEEILRQLREEERALFLADLEARFQKMLGLQLVVYNGTVGLSKTPKEQWESRHRSRSIELARQEDEIALEAAKALTLLKEDGSSVAFPEAVQQLRQDMLTIARRLERSEVAELTQTIEKDVIEALEELITALQKEMEKQNEKKQQQPQEGEPQDPPLVDVLAELKMLRSLQLRINGRTRRLGTLIDGEQATDPDVLTELQKLSNRQARVQQATYDLATGRNQ